MTSSAAPDADSDKLPLWSEAARTNWLWLADLPQWQRVLDLWSDAASQMRGLADHFAAVHCLRWRGRMPGPTESVCTPNVVSAWATPVDLPYADGAFDCVTLNDASVWALAVAQGANLARTWEQLLPECRRVLRPGGCLYVAVSNGQWWRHVAGRFGPRRTGARSRPAVRAGPVPGPRRLHRTVPRFFGLGRSLTRAGFARLQTYCVEPSHERPECFIPLERRAVLAYERVGRDVSPHAHLRRVLVWLGLGRVLYPSLIYLAYA